MQNDLGVNALVSGLVMMPSDIAMGVLNPVAGKMYDRIGGRPLALLGFAIMTSAAVLLVTIMNTHTAAAMRTGVPEAAASAIGVRASFRTVAIVCAVCLVASLFIRDRGRRLDSSVKRFIHRSLAFLMVSAPKLPAPFPYLPSRNRCLWLSRRKIAPDRQSPV